MNTPEQTEKLYDLSFLEEMDDDEYLLSMLNLLVEETPKDLTAMKHAAVTGDADTVAKKAHVLKSTAGIIRVNAFVEMMVTIETIAKDNNITPELLALVDDSILLFATVETGLKERMATLQ